MSVVELTRTGWGFAPGDTIVSGLRAWACLGGGRRCESWLAWSMAWWMPVVLKLPRPGLVDDPETRADLAHEAGGTAGLAHPGVQRRDPPGAPAPPASPPAQEGAGPTPGGLLHPG